ncbi:MAG: SRPBCC domain-containing protein [Pirellulaceae bacterium]
MNDVIHVIVTHKLPCETEQAFQFWTKPHWIRRWMAGSLRQMGLPGDVQTVEVTSGLGGSFCFSDRRDMGEVFHWGTYTVWDEPSQLAFTWNADLKWEPEIDDATSLVTIKFDQVEGGCEIELVHQMDSQWVEYEERTKKGWTSMLESIRDLINSP